MAWQRPVRYGVAAAGIAFAVGLYFVIGKKPAPTPGPPAVPHEGGLTHAEKQGSTERTKNDVVDAELGYETLKEFSDGRKEFGGLSLNFTRGDRKFHVTSAKALTKEKAGTTTSTIPEETELTGNVVIQASDGLELHTEEATYTDVDGMTFMPGKVTFKRDRVSGTGVGATYDQIRDVLWLQSAAEIDTAADPQGQGVTHASARQIGVDRADHFMRLDDDGDCARRPDHSRQPRGVVSDARQQQYSDYGIARQIERRPARRQDGRAAGAAR